ncbi:MAG: hypothetical protein AB1801_05865 [Chloroflexota bacterium]
MRTQKQLYPQISKVYICELEVCSSCGSLWERCDYLSGRKIERAGVLTITGMLPSPINTDQAAEPSARLETEPGRPAPVEPEQAELETAFKRRVRYLLTLKGRPPFRLAGIEMYERLTEVSVCLAEMIAHAPSAGLAQLQQGLDQSLTMVEADYLHLSQGADWLHQISNLLDPQAQPAPTAEQVRTALLTYLDEMQRQSQNNVILTEFARQITKTTRNYLPGLFHTYDLPDLPRTNNDRESEFRRLNQQLLRTTGQKGATRRLIQRSGAWELIARPASLTETVEIIAAVEYQEYV